MSASASASDKLAQLDTLEREIANCISLANEIIEINITWLIRTVDFSQIKSISQALTELSKDKPSVKQVEGHSNNFIKSLENIDNGLSKHINYLVQVSTGHPHEGSSYAAQKDVQMTLHRLEHVKSRMAELERMKKEHLRVRNQSQSSLHRILSQPDTPV